MPPRTGKNSRDLNAELVIIGGGGAGLCAALAAAENGLKKIIVLEKRGAPGGNTALASGPFACESPTQARENIIADKDALFKHAMDWAHWSRVNPRIFRAFLNKSGDTVLWLEQMGLEFTIRTFFPNQVPRVQHVAKGRGAHMIKVLAAQCRERGVTLLPRHGAKKILTSKNKGVNGVVFSGENGESVIKTKVAIIATGGFTGNKALLKKYCPPYFDGMGNRGVPLTGDGLLMAQEAGAAIDDFVTLLKEGPRVDLHTWPLMSLERESVTLWVNKKGERFTDESIGMHPFEAANPILLQPGKVNFTLLDTAIKEKMAARLGDLDRALETEINRGRVKRGRSWKEIAAWIGAAPAALQAAVAEYNSFCTRGYDALFAKDRRHLLPLTEPPFYAIRCHPHMLDTMGGIIINERMEVLDAHDAPIRGLYAAGVVASGWESENYCSNLSGSALGFAVNSGRIAGESAAGYLSGRK
jgi:fumarate reductase flavoprotein subunit